MSQLDTNMSQLNKSSFSSPDAKLPLLLEPEELFASDYLGANTASVIVIEQCDLETFNKGHIPGSVHVDFKAFQWGRLPTPGAPPELNSLCALLGSLGVTPTSHIVCSDNEGGGWAGRLIWLLDSIGHKFYSYLNGGLNAWQLSGLETTDTASTVLPQAPYPATQYDRRPSVTKAEILSLIENDDFIVWDARSHAEYTGEKAISARGGHIPKAVHYEWTKAMNPSQGLRLRDLPVIERELQDLGIERHKYIVTHCQSHHRSGLTYLIGKLLNLPVKAYPGSWAEWGNDPATPIIVGDEPNK